MQQQILIRIKPLVTGVTCNIPDEMFKDLCISSNFTSQNCPTIPPWCIASTCLCRLNRFPNLILQTGHFYVLRPACTRLTCLFRLSFISKDLVHSEHLYVFSSGIYNNIIIHHIKHHIIFYDRNKTS